MLQVRHSQATSPLVPRASTPLQPPAKKPRSVNYSSILITREASAIASEGLEVLLGTYIAQVDQLNHSMVVYKKLPEAHDEDPVFLYFWGNSKDDRGWWLGHEVNGAEAYCWAPSTGFPPPTSGWRIPADDQPRVEDLRVIYPAPATGPADPEQPNQPKTVPPKLTPASRPSPFGASLNQKAASVRGDMERSKTSSSQASQPKTVPPKAKGVAERSAVVESACVRSEIERLASLTRLARQPKRVPAKAGAEAASDKAELERLASLGQSKTVPAKTNGVAEGAACARANLEKLKASLGQGNHPKTVPPKAKGSAERSPAAKTLQPRSSPQPLTTPPAAGVAAVVATVPPGTLRAAAISAGLSSEEAVWLDRFYQNRSFYWRTVNVTKTQTEDIQLATAGKALIENWPKS